MNIKDDVVIHQSSDEDNDNDEGDRFLSFVEVVNHQPTDPGVTEPRRSTRTPPSTR